MIKTPENETFALCLGEVLRNIRKDKIKLSQRQLGEKIGLSQQTISVSEAGKSMASVYLLYKYCEVAGIEPSQAINEVNRSLNGIMK